MNWKLALAFALSLTTSSPPAISAELKVLSVGTVGGVLRDVIPTFERESGNRIQISFGNPVTTVERLRRGESFDVVILATALWGEAEKLGKLNLETGIELPATPFGIGKKTGTKKPETMNIPTFLSLANEAKSIALVDRSPATALLMRNLATHGIASHVEAKTKLYPTGEAIAEALAHGEVELGITTMSELVSNLGVVVLGTMPPEILSLKARTSAATTKETSSSKEALAFLQFLRSPAVTSVFRAKGFDPI